MKQFVMAIVFGAFISVALFGFAGVGNSHHHCVASVVNGVDCPYRSGTMPFIDFHFSALRTFSTAIVGASAANIFLAALLFISLLGLFKLFGDGKTVSLAISREKENRADPPASLFKLKFNRWFALHERAGSAIAASSCA